METLEKMKLGSPEKAAMASMYEETFQNFEEGSVIEGTVISVKKDKVVVDIGYKSEGIIAAEEFSPQELAALAPGVRLPVYIEEREDSEGNLILSKEKADKMKVWEDLEKTFKEEAIVEGRIISRIKGGMMVDIGVKAFLPGSQIDLHPIRDPEQLIGKTFPIVGNFTAGGYYGLNDKLLVSSTGKKEQGGGMAAWTSPDVVLNLPGLNKVNFIADVQTGKNVFGAWGAGVGLYFTPAVDILMGPVFFLDKDLAKNTFGSDFMWSVQLDIDVDLIKKKS